MGRWMMVLLVLCPAPGQESGEIRSPRVEKLRRELTGGRAAVEAFWQEIAAQGSPLLESIPGDTADVLVTFLLRGGADLTMPIVFASVLPNQDPLQQQLSHLPGTDVWHRTYRFPRDLPILYELSVDGPEKLQRDPLNGKFMDGPMGGSVAILPGVRNLEWAQKRQVAQDHDRPAWLSIDAIRNGRRS